MGRHHYETAPTARRGRQPGDPSCPGGWYTSLMNTTRKLTNVEVARKLGMHHSYVSRLRTGDRVASIPTLIAISDVYDVPIGRLTRAASKAAKGDPGDWVDLLNDALVAREEVPA